MLSYFTYCNHSILLNVYGQVDRYATTCALLWMEEEKTVWEAQDIKIDGCHIQYLTVYYKKHCRFFLS